MFRVPGDEVLILRLDKDDVTVEIRCTTQYLEAKVEHTGVQWSVRWPTKQIQ